MSLIISMKQIPAMCLIHEFTLFFEASIFLSTLICEHLLGDIVRRNLRDDDRCLVGVLGEQWPVMWK